MDIALSPNLGTAINNRLFKNTRGGTEGNKLFGNWYSATTNFDEPPKTQSMASVSPGTTPGEQDDHNPPGPPARRNESVPLFACWNKLSKI